MDWKDAKGLELTETALGEKFFVQIHLWKFKFNITLVTVVCQ